MFKYVWNMCLNSVAFKSRCLLSSDSDIFFILALSITFPFASNVAIKDGNLQKTERLVITIMLTVTMTMEMLIAMIVVMMNIVVLLQIQLPVVSLARKPVAIFATLSFLLNFLLPNANVNLLKEIEKESKFLSFG